MKFTAVSKISFSILESHSSLLNRVELTSLLFVSYLKIILESSLEISSVIVKKKALPLEIHTFL